MGSYVLICGQRYLEDLGSEPNGPRKWRALEGREVVEVDSA